RRSHHSVAQRPPGRQPTDGRDGPRRARHHDAWPGAGGGGADAHAATGLRRQCRRLLPWFRQGRQDRTLRSRRPGRRGDRRCRLLGSGRTETAELLFGVERADRGTAEVGGKAVTLASPRVAVAEGFGFCPEDRKTAGIVAALSLRENIVLALQARRGWARPLPRREQNALADRYIAALDIRSSDREQPVGLLSGGNQ